MKSTLLLFLFLLSSNAYCTIINITVNTRFFAPNSINGTVGDTLNFQWVEGFHTTTCDGTNGSTLPPGANPWDSPMDATTPNFMYIINVPGSYHFICLFHAPLMSGDLNVVLPVELVSFSASAGINHVRLNWTTNYEINNAGFDIERKSAAETWRSLGNVSGHGNTKIPINYTFTDNNVTAGSYGYRLKQLDFNGKYKYYYLAYEVIVGIPEKFSLSQNFPNPFNPSTKINFDLPVSSIVRLEVFDIEGKTKAVLIDGIINAGSHSVELNSSTFTSGVYFYRIKAGEFTSTKRMVLLK